MILIKILIWSFFEAYVTQVKLSSRLLNIGNSQGSESETTIRKAGKVVSHLPRMPETVLTTGRGQDRIDLGVAREACYKPRKVKRCLYWNLPAI